MLKRMMCVFAAIAATFLALSGGARAATLEIGDKAPVLGDHVKWIKGDAAPEFQEGQIYVLDFWATWCGPCIASMPHMSEVARKHKDDGVTVIGVAIWPRPGNAAVADFVKQSPDRMDYAVAEDVDNWTAKAYMDATDSNSIPTVAIIDRKGDLAWLGHPNDGMDQVLAKVIAGAWDARHMKDLNAKAKPLLDKANDMARQGDWDGAMSMIDQLIALDHAQFGHYAVSKYGVLHQRLGKVEEAKAYGRLAIDQIINDDAELMNQLAWFIVDAPIDNRDLDLALAAAKKASALEKDSNAAILDTLAAVYAARNEMQDAVATQRKAVKLVTDPSMREDMKSRLDEYESKAKN